MGIVASPEPLHEGQDILVSPHPRREAPKVRQCRVGVIVMGEPHHVAVDTVGIGPIGLDRHRGEPALVDEATGNTGSLPVELVRAVRGLADQNETPVPDEIEQCVIVARLGRDRTAVVGYHPRGQRRPHSQSVALEYRWHQGRWSHPHTLPEPAATIHIAITCVPGRRGWLLG